LVNGFCVVNEGISNPLLNEICSKLDFVLSETLDGLSFDHLKRILKKGSLWFASLFQSSDNDEISIYQNDASDPGRWWMGGDALACALQQKLNALTEETMKKAFGGANQVFKSQGLGFLLSFENTLPQDHHRDELLLCSLELPPRIVSCIMAIHNSFFLWVFPGSHLHQHKVEEKIVKYFINGQAEYVLLNDVGAIRGEKVLVEVGQTIFFDGQVVHGGESGRSLRVFCHLAQIQIKSGLTGDRNFETFDESTSNGKKLPTQFQNVYDKYMASVVSN